MRFNSVEQNPSQQTLYGTKRYLKKTSRLQVLGGLSTGIVAAQAAPVFAEQSSTPANQQGTSSQETPNQSVRQNPVKQYPSPLFSRQPQERPDHGEKSYQDYGQLVGCKALITGGNSGIGRVAAIAFAREGADVAIKSRLDSVQLL